MRQKIFFLKKLLYYIKIYGFLEVYRIFCDRLHIKYLLNDYKIYDKYKVRDREKSKAYLKNHKELSKDILLVSYKDYSNNIDKALNKDIDLINKKIIKKNFDINGKDIFDVSESDIKNYRYFLFMKEDVFFLEEGLGEIYRAILEKDDMDIIYSDSDNYIFEGEFNQNKLINKSYIKKNIYGLNKFYFINPKFKPDFNLEYLEGYNYIGDAFLVSTRLCKIEDFKVKNNISWEIILRYIDRTKKIYHIPEIVFHERIINNTKDLEVFEKNALLEHFNRIKEKVKIKRKGQSVYEIEKNIDNYPKVSIIVPNKDNVSDLKRCFTSFNNSNYKNIEWIIVENNSEKKETFLFYKELEKNENVKVIYYEGKFNFSKISNLGAKHSNGELILFLNNDTELLDKNSINKMVLAINRIDVGIVGAKLIYGDNTIQHAGVIVEVGGFACHSFAYLDSKDTGYMNRAAITNEFSAVTAACMLVKRDVFNEVCGFLEEMEVAGNDVDLCMKVRAKGYRILCEMSTKIFHYESKSRGDDRKDLKKSKRLQHEVDLFSCRWIKELKKGDPFYNKNLSRGMAYEIALKKQEWNRPFFYR